MTTSLPAISPFEPANEAWEAYLERFECFLQANGLSDLSSDRKRGYFLSFCGRDIFATARALTAPQPVSSVPWETLLEKLRAHYCGSFRIARRHAFRQRFQKEKPLTTTWLPCVSPPYNLQRRLLARNDVTLQIALDEARASEMSVRSVAELQRYHTRSATDGMQQSVHYEDVDDDAPSDEDDAVSHLKATRKKEWNTDWKGSQGGCLGCGGSHHRADCRFRAAICRRCGRKGHLSRVCRASLPANQKPNPQLKPKQGARRLPTRRDECHAVDREGIAADAAVSHASTAVPAHKIYLSVKLEGVPFKMEIDTGSSRSLVAWHTLRRLLPNFPKRRLQPCQIILRDYQGNQIPTAGCTTLHVSFGSFEGKLPLVVVRDDLPSLLGLDWFAALHLDVSGVHTTSLDTPNQLFSEFADVFDGQLGKYTGRPISFNLDPQIAPIRLKPRRVPLALRPKVDKELDKLVAQGVLEPIEYSLWETPIVIPLKPDGSIRICADYKCTINKALQANRYPLPVVQHLLHSLGRGRAIVTHRGAFRCNRLQFGVSIAPGLFQGLMERLLQGLPGVVPYFDDVLISAIDRSELVERLTDHKPLLGLMSGDRQTPQILSPRMSRWVEFLAAYSYKLIYKPGKFIGHADALSRCPLPTTDPDPAPTSPVLLVEDWDVPVSASSIRDLSARDPILSTVLDWVRRGWPGGLVSPDFQPFIRRQHELSVLKGCLLWGNRVVVPPGLRQRILACLHDAHPGIVRMKALGRSYVWWPGMDQEIEAWVATCPQCQASRPAPPAVPIRTWELPRAPWARVHMDFAGPFMGQTFLILVDAYSNWVEIGITPSPTSGAVIRILDGLFATHGLPDVIVTDNGPQFTSAPFRQFLAMRGIRHAPAAPFHPAGNGRAERAVRSAKEALGRLRRLRTTLDRLHPNFTSDVPNTSSIPYRSFREGDLVYVENYGGGSRWVSGQITQLTGPYSYRVLLTDGRQWRRHVNQLRRRIPGEGQPAFERSIPLPTYNSETPPDFRNQPTMNDAGPNLNTPSTTMEVAPRLSSVPADTAETSIPAAISTAGLPETQGIPAMFRSNSNPPAAASSTAHKDDEPTPATSGCILRRSGRSRRRPAYLADYACAVWG
ncbi:uncharacterized protein K02A2.6-like [Ahaetulla prasina]|uniref:uncharacterized protein K02A2.6-like n=1 Tax=Ahaetulla prasina TaxID=499056 RepID=UPI0026478A23|nr:uncharacterized protein K02A2.6-like [Ahaetulla prasina]